MIRPTTLFVAAAVTLASATASAHIRLNEPAPRFEPGTANQKTAMCGTGTPTGDVTWYQPGEMINVQWDETIDHPGHFRISVDSDGGDDDLVDPTDYNDFYVAPSVLLDDIPDNGGSMFSAMVTLPNVECEKCTLQVIQIMTDKAPWGPGGGNDIYYWCADIRISATPPMTTATTSGTGGSAATTTTSAGVTTSGSGSGGAAGSGGNGAGGGGSSGSTDDGCGCSTVGGGSAPLGGVVTAVGAAAMALLRRRRRVIAR